jgi:hypothetical protein
VIRREWALPDIPGGYQAVQAFGTQNVKRANVSTIGTIRNEVALRDLLPFASKQAQLIFIARAEDCSQVCVVCSYRNSLCDHDD